MSGILSVTVSPAGANRRRAEFPRLFRGIREWVQVLQATLQALFDQPKPPPRP
jgi:hypothetical protein